MVGFMFFLGCRGPFDEPPCSDPWNPDCVNYDPCLSQDTAWAEFDILQQLRAGNTSFGDTTTFVHVTDDTFFFPPWQNAEYVFFRARADYPQRYYWKIGTDARVFTDSAFSLIFKEGIVPPSGTIECRLVACLDSIDRTCFPRARLCDTVTHSFFYMFTKMSEEPYYPTGGHFSCYFEGMPDTFCVTIWPGSGKVGNIPPEGFTVVCFPYAVSYPELAFVGPKKIDFLNVEVPPSYYSRVRGYGIVLEHPRRLEFEIDIRPFRDSTDLNWKPHRMICVRKE